MKDAVLEQIQRRLRTADAFTTVASWCRDAASRSGTTPQQPPPSLQARGFVGSLPAFLLYRLAEDAKHPLLCVVGDEDAAAYLFSDLEQLGGASARLLRLPASGATPYDAEQMADVAPVIERADVLQQLTGGFRGLVVASVDALFERVPPPEAIRGETVELAVGQLVGPEVLVERLVAQGFERTEFVEQPGELALRGGILDVYPFSGDYPIRIEFFGDEIDSIREFDVATQRSISKRSAARLVPNLEANAAPDATFTSLFEHFPPDLIAVLFEETRLAERADALFAAAAEHYHARTATDGADVPPPERRYLDGNALTSYLSRYPTLALGPFADASARGDRTEIVFDARPQPSVGGKIERLRARLAENAAGGVASYILCDSGSQRARLQDLLEETIEAGAVTLAVESLHEGFEVPALGIAVYTDHQIFNRYHRPTARKRRRKFGGLTLRELQNLSPGDFVVHVDYGIGKFAGMQKIEVGDKHQEAVRILFQDNDVLYLNVSALHKLHKYTGKEGHQPRLTKLGSGQWEKAKARTKKRVKDIARDLIQLYARRKASRGHGFSPDSVWQRELEASFEFEDTPDQAATAEAVKLDMQQPHPMDRLVCGDVGFGKTEIAVRAAFKAVQDGRQVAVLVPTTILADQHFRTFRRRLAGFPVRIDVLSRFRSAKEQKQVARDLSEGKVDIIIGTHRLVSKDVNFKSLGLLIIDEEQRFGVAVKEQLRKMRAEVDTLALSATPIPRTLQFSLMGARDLSIISTPPPNRQPIVTEIHTFNKDLIRDALLYEVSRGGQVFFIHNRVQSIYEMAETIRALVPDVRIRVGHGQMKSSELEEVMMEFMEGRFDVLVCTNIVESGLDVSNANTIIINHAERFGLSDLHQLRGRVGRSDRKAFCYLLVNSVHALTREARQRLQALEEFSDLGSGFNIAMRDLDIRGAGNLLGGEQSGFIEEVGFETYHRLLDEAVQELRQEEFSGLFDADALPPPPETVVDVEEDAFLPEAYVSNNVERLNLYRRLSDVVREVELGEMRTELEDRFGPLPAEVENLLTAVGMRLQAQTLRLPRLSFKNRRLFLDMPTPEEDPFFYQHYFNPLLERLGRLDRRYALKETSSKRLRAIVQNVPDLATARSLLEAVALHEEAAGA